MTLNRRDVPGVLLKVVFDVHSISESNRKKVVEIFFFDIIEWLMEYPPDALKWLDPYRPVVHAGKMILLCHIPENEETSKRPT